MKNKVIVIASILLIVIGAIISGAGLTGNVIGYFQYSNYMGIILILLGISFLLFSKIRDLDGQMLFGFGESNTQKKAQYSTKITPEYYAKFVRAVEGRGMPISKFQWRKTKQEMLLQYFPEQFSKQNLEGYSNRELGEAFSNLLNYAREQSKKYKK